MVSPLQPKQLARPLVRHLLPLFVATFFLGSAWAATTKVYELKDGTAYVGTVVEELEAGVLLKTNTGKIVKIKYSDIANITPLSGQQSGDRASDSTNETGLRTGSAMTLDLAELIGPGFLLEVSGEGALHKNHSLTGSVGFGEIYGLSLNSFGIQYRAYVIGNFDAGTNLGIEEVYATVSNGASSASVLATVVSVGGKYTAKNGFVIDGRIGYASINNFETSPMSQLAWALNLGYGW
jgi:hypothetical protein